MIHPLISVFFDGTCGPLEPGEFGSSAFVVYKDDEVVHKEARFFEANGTPVKATYAEYLAIIDALKWLLEKEEFKTHVRFYGDSLEVVRQLTGIWEVSPNLEHSYVQVKNLASKLRDVSFNCVTFRRNMAAATLAEQELLKNGVQPVRLTLKKSKKETA